MKRVRITVIRKACYRDLMERYENPIEHACDLHEGQSFVAEGWTRPAGLCESAWQTLSPFVMVLSHGATALYDGWMKNPASAMLSCNDGFRPVSFLVEALDEEAADTPANAGDAEDTATADNRPHPDGCSPTIPAPGRPAFPTAAPPRPATAGPEPAAAGPATGSPARSPKNTDTEKTEP